MTASFEPDIRSRLQHRLAAGAADTLVIVFSQVRVPAGKFGLERLFTRTRHSCLFLNDTANGWYLGLESGVHSAIGKALAETGATRIIYYGSSMGGYGALATGLTRRDGDIHAFGPELRTGYPGSQSRDYGIAPEDPRLFDWRHAPRPAFPVHLYFGVYDPVDAVNAAAAAHVLPEAQLHLLRSCHASHDHLYSLNLIRRIITTFSRDPCTELASKNMLATVDMDALGAFGTLAERLAAGETLHPDDVAGLAGFAENPGMIRLAAEASAASGDLPGAVTFLRRAEDLVESDPVLRTLPKRWRKEIPLRQVECLIGCGALERARDVLAHTCERFPVDDRMTVLANELGVRPASGDVTGPPAD